MGYGVDRSKIIKQMPMATKYHALHSRTDLPLEVRTSHDPILAIVKELGECHDSYSGVWVLEHLTKNLHCALEVPPKPM
jgi:hypothetical protein